MYDRYLTLYNTIRLKVSNTLQNDRSKCSRALVLSSQTLVLAVLRSMEEAPSLLHSPAAQLCGLSKLRPLKKLVRDKRERWTAF